MLTQRNIRRSDLLSYQHKQIYKETFFLYKQTYQQAPFFIQKHKNKQNTFFTHQHKHKQNTLFNQHIHTHTKHLFYSPTPSNKHPFHPPTQTFKQTPCSSNGTNNPKKNTMTHPPTRPTAFRPQSQSGAKGRADEYRSFNEEKEAKFPKIRGSRTI